MRKIVTICALILSFSSTAFASDTECTAETLQKKGLEAATAMQQLAATNPTLMQEIAMDLQKAQSQAATAGGDYTELCKVYDDILAKTK